MQCCRQSAETREVVVERVFRLREGVERLWRSDWLTLYVFLLASMPKDFGRSD